MEGSAQRIEHLDYLRRFNGAIAFQRWKDVAPLLDVYGGGYASMGPSPFSDGRIGGVAPIASRTSRLQWGHRLSAMEGS